MNREYLSPVVCLIWGNLITGMLHEYFVNENFRLVVKKGEIDIEIYLTRVHLTRHCFFRCNRHDKVCLVFQCPDNVIAVLYVLQMVTNYIRVIHYCKKAEIFLARKR